MPDARRRRRDPVRWVDRRYLHARERVRHPALLASELADLERLHKNCHGVPFYGEERPIVKRRGVKVCSVRPYERVDFRIEANSSKEFGIPQRSVSLAGKQRAELYGLLRAVIEFNSQCVGVYTFEQVTRRRATGSMPTESGSTLRCRTGKGR